MVPLYVLFPTCWSRPGPEICRCAFWRSTPLTVAFGWTVDPAVIGPDGGVMVACPSNVTQELGLDASAGAFTPTVMAAAASGVITATAAALRTFLTTPSLRREFFRR